MRNSVTGCVRRFGFAIKSRIVPGFHNMLRFRARGAPYGWRIGVATACLPGVNHRCRSPGHKRARTLGQESTHAGLVPCVFAGGMDFADLAVLTRPQPCSSVIGLELE